MNISNKIIFIFILLILPVLFELTGFYLYSINGPYYLRSVDPEYIYLFNGICLSHLKTGLLIDHPGTPLQIFIAATSRIIYLFRDNNSLIEDVMQHPEFYLKTVNFAIISFASVILFISGYLIYIITENIYSALFIQLSPFIAEPVITIIERTMPEALFIPVILILVTFLIYIIHENSPEKKLIKYNYIIFGIILGLGIALKITFLPLIFIPLVLLKGIKKKLLYLLISILGFLIFAFPVLLQPHHYLNWIKNILVFTGKYGQGEPTFLNIKSFILNLNTIIQQFTFLFIPIILSTATIIFMQVPQIKNKIISKNYSKALYGLYLSQIFLLFFAVKHYSSYYMIPIMLLCIFNYYILIKIYSALISKYRYFSEIALYMVVVIILIIPNYKIVKSYISIRNEKLLSKSETVEVIKQLPEYDAVLISSDSWSSREELALWFGKLFIKPKYRVLFNPVLKNEYPNRFFYKDGWDCFLDWEDNKQSLDDLVKKYQSISILLNRYDLKIRNKFITLLNEQPDCKLDTIFENDNTGEILFELHHNSY